MQLPFLNGNGRGLADHLEGQRCQSHAHWTKPGAGYISAHKKDKQVSCPVHYYQMPFPHGCGIQNSNPLVNP